MENQLSTEKIVGVIEIPFGEAAKYLSPFYGNYSGYGRQGSVQVSGVDIADNETGTDITVEARDPELGRYRLVFKEVTVKRDPIGECEEPYLGDPDDPEDDDPDIDDPDTFMDPDKVRARSLARLRRLLEHGDWSVHDAFGRYYGTIRPLRGFARGSWPDEAEQHLLEKQMLEELVQDRSVTLGLSSRNFMGITAAELVIWCLETDRVAGSCPGCGGTKYYLTCQAGMTLEASEDGSLGISSEVRTPAELVEAISLRNVLVGVHCSSCGLDHPKKGAVGGFTGVIRGLGWDGECQGISASVGRVGRLLDGDHGVKEETGQD
jgi:hypothetical protein